MYGACFYQAKSKKGKTETNAFLKEHEICLGAFPLTELPFDSKVFHLAPVQISLNSFYSEHLDNSSLTNLDLVPQSVLIIKENSQMIFKLRHDREYRKITNNYEFDQHPKFRKLQQYLKDRVCDQDIGVYPYELELMIYTLITLNEAEKQWAKQMFDKVLTDSLKMGQAHFKHEEELRKQQSYSPQVFLNTYTHANFSSHELKRKKELYVMPQTKLDNIYNPDIFEVNSITSFFLHLQEATFQFDPGDKSAEILAQVIKVLPSEASEILKSINPEDYS